jgi:hypothetical protein
LFQSYRIETITDLNAKPPIDAQSQLCRFRKVFFGKARQTSKLHQGNAYGAFLDPPLPVFKPVAIQIVLPAKFNLGKSACLPPAKNSFPVGPFFFAFYGSALFHDCLLLVFWRPSCHDFSSLRRWGCPNAYGYAQRYCLSGSI